MLKVVIGLCLFVAIALSSTGVDVSTAVSQSAFSCLAQKGFTNAIIRCLRSSGTVDPNCASNVANARAAGFSTDIYAFPCPKCSASGSSQISSVISYLNSNNVQYSTLWLDIEGPQYWGTTATNQAFFQDMVDAAKSSGVTVGVYTSSSQWEPIMGSSTAGSSFPLWYAHYDNVESFSDFSAFGGWSSPDMKQYNGNQNVCGAGVDLNWMPGGGSTAASTTGSNSGNSGNSGNSNSGNSGNSGHSGSGNSGNSGHSGSGNSGSGNSGNSGHSGSGNSGSGNSGTSGNGNSGNGNSGNGNSNTNTDGTSYSSGSGSSSSGSGSDFLSENAIYSKIGGGKFSSTKKLSNNNRKNKVDLLIESDLELPSAEDKHFQVLEEKSPKKFF